MASLELITNLKLIDGSARTTVPTPEELPLGYMCFGIVNSRASIWGNYDGSVHDLVEEGTHQVGGDLNLENGTGTGSLVQKRLKSDGVTWTTAKAYQGAAAAFGGNTQAGRTEEEFNAYFWDSTNNVALNGGKGKDSNGNILDSNGLTYAKSYSYALAEGESTKALGRSSHAEGNATQSIGNHSHAEGLSTKAEGYASHAEGYLTNANGGRSHSEGESTKSEGLNSHAEGNGTQSLGEGSHAEGGSTLSSGTYAHSEGESTKAQGKASHSEGNSSESIGECSHSEGLNTKAEGYAAHTEGVYTEAYYTGSHAEGNHTKTYTEYQHVGGTYNYYKNNALYIVGNGTSDNDRKNAFEVLRDGRAKVQSAPTESDDVVRKQELDKKLDEPSSIGDTGFVVLNANGKVSLTPTAALNSKLTAPTKPTEDSVVTMMADRKTGTKALSEFGGKLYKHEITIDVEQKHNYVFIFAYLNHDTVINTFDLLFENRDLLKGSTIRKMFQIPVENDMGILYDVQNNYGIIFINVVLGAGGSTSFDLTDGYSMTDTVTEL